MIKNLLQSHPEWVTIGFHAAILLVSIAIMYLFVMKVGSKKSLLDSSETINEGAYPKQPSVSEKQILENSKYVQKKASRHTKDVNRYGRWSLTLKDDSVITRIGFLYTVLRNVPPVKHYREIK